MENNLVYAYTRKMSIEDGQQFELDSKIRTEAGIKFPVFITDTLYNLIEEAIADEKKCYDFNGIIWDIFTMFRLEVKKGKDDRIVSFEVFINEKKQKIYAEVGATDIDDPRPAITLMRENDL